ncbi:signal peptidase I [Pseudodesulfovibrio sp.]|uniref:signal peptidase I n=1 Tax=Pseudodesulfovibrio sp. TaxID=2035812 RepID=UPI00260C910B|nr:signal peptidase I [Pseudodesulfovibrio sp.]MDD3313558.1 signal peptidase I [Pseudodesulfovibrio sp.]
MSTDETPEIPRTPDGPPPPPAPGTAVLRRRPWLAALLSLVATGLGQVYNGQWRKGLLFFFTEFGLGVVLYLSMGTFAGVVAAGAVLAAINLAAPVEAYLSARRLGAISPGRWNRGWVYVLAVAVSLASGAALQAGMGATLYEAYKAPSASMLPTLQVGDHFMAEVLSPADPVRRGDVVTFLEAESGKRFVKRVVGLPGETVSIEAQRVSVDGRPLDEPYAAHDKAGQDLPGRDRMDPVALGPDEYFCMGDNREHSYDSRWLGPVARGRMLARALYVYLPGPSADRWSRLGASLR